MTASAQAIRTAEYHISELPAGSKLTVPSVGFDFGSHHVRTAIVRQVDDKIAISLATFHIDALDAAVSHARKLFPDDKAIPVFYTGHSTPDRHALLAKTFPKATSIERRDKLQCHCSGARLLINSKLPFEELFHDIDIDQEQLKKLLAVIEMSKPFLPPRMLKTMDALAESVREQSHSEYPLILSIVGSNNILCQLNNERDKPFSVVDARCIGGHAIEAFWNRMKSPNSPGDFGSFVELAAKGNRRKVDSLTSELAEAIGFYSSMPADYPIFNFGKMEVLHRNQVAAEDLARALSGMYSDLIIMKARDIGMQLKSYPLYFSGSLVQHRFFREDIMLRTTFYGDAGIPNPRFFKTDAVAALGACLAD